MTQTPDTNPTRSTVTAPAAVRIIGRNLAEVAATLRDIEPDEMSRPDLLALLGVIAAGLELSAALLDHNADRLNAEAVARADMLDLAERARADRRRSDTAAIIEAVQ